VVTLETPAVIDIAVATGLDWVCIDLEHGYLTYPQVANLLRAADRTDLTVLVRVPSHDLEPTKRVLDLGAHGVVVPFVSTPDTLRQIRDWAYYPPQGARGLGGERNVQWGLGLQQYVDNANKDIMVVPVVETRQGVENLDAILDVPGTEALIIGPGDLSSSYGHLGQWEGPGSPRSSTTSAKEREDVASLAESSPETSTTLRLGATKASAWWVLVPISAW
jgi:2-keto-3-deoxy-L-rhamnonate aldolase RhmA